jgi:hypothetical protein
MRERTKCLQPWRWRHYVSSKLWHLPTSLHGTKTQKNNNRSRFLCVCVWGGGGVRLGGRPTRARLPPIPSTVRSLIKLNAIVTSRLPAGIAIVLVSWFYCFYGAVLDSYRKTLVALGGESCSSSREVTGALNFISGRTVRFLITITYPQTQSEQTVACFAKWLAIS